MRTHLQGIKRQSEPLVFTFDSTPIKAYPGETIASALIAAGIWDLRKGRDGSSRGLFCGMGVCGECRVRIGAKSRRACLEPVLHGLSVRRHQPQAPAESGDDNSWITPWKELLTDVLIIGAGPAGLSAAKTASASGLEVLVIDERHSPGGQYFKQPGDGFDVIKSNIDSQFSEGLELIRAAQECGAQFMFDATVWGTFGPHKIAVSVDGQTCAIRPKRLILSTGAYERAVPVPGWTLPGVLTTGAAQTLLRAYQTAPGKRVLIAGNGPLNLQVAYELFRAGVQVKTVAELAPSPYLASPVAALKMAYFSPDLFLKGIQQLISLRVGGVPLRYRHALVAAQGDDKVSAAVIAKLDNTGNIIDGSQKTLDVDAICVNYGFLPQSELARSLGCNFKFDAKSATLTAERDEDGRTNIKHVFIVGDAGSLGGAKVAMDQGALAGLAVAKDLKKPDKQQTNISKYRKTLRRHWRFQEALWRVFNAPCLTTQLAEEDTLICRCEEIDKQTIERCFNDRSTSITEIKRTTRAGMGRCQGRYCTTLLAALTNEISGSKITADDLFAPRAPFKPISLAELSGNYGNELKPQDLLTISGHDAIKSP
jgi:NADPH-dependent 2,4-dienoyl-CoA reductase/sulfur reductase-like enzyme